MTERSSYRGIRDQLGDGSRSAFRRYQHLVVGSTSLGYTLRYELVTAVGGLAPGGAGLWFRSRFYRRLFRRCDGGLIVGAGVTLRSPCKVELGRNALLADGAVVDGRGGGAGPTISLGDDVVVGERAMIRCKDGVIHVGDRVGVGAGAHFSAVGGNLLRIENDVLIGPHAYLGGTRYHLDRLDVPIREQGHDLRGGIRIGSGAWLGAYAVVVDGVAIGRDAVVAAGAVVVSDVPDYAVVGGVPAKVLRSRSPQETNARVG